MGMLTEKKNYLSNSASNGKLMQISVMFPSGCCRCHHRGETKTLALSGLSSQYIESLVVLTAVFKSYP